MVQFSEPLCQVSDLTLDAPEPSPESQLHSASVNSLSFTSWAIGCSGFESKPNSQQISHSQIANTFSQQVEYLHTRILSVYLPRKKLSNQIKFLKERNAQRHLTTLLKKYTHDLD
jgi:hypothetical protein